MYLDEISIWERPIHSLQKSYPNGKVKGSGILKHDYIVIKQRSSSFEESSSSSYIVEKVDKPEKSPVFNCAYVKKTSFEGPIQGHIRRTYVDLKGARVQVKDLTSILEQDGHSYDLVSKNCWKYAHGTTLRVIQLCENAVYSSKDKQSIMDGTYLQELKEVERIMPSDAFRGCINLILTIGTILGIWKWCSFQCIFLILTILGIWKWCWH